MSLALETRLAVNQAYSSEDLTEWLMSRLEVKLGEDILDVACGTGVQTIPFAEAVGITGSVSALDIAPTLPALPNVQVVKGSMEGLEYSIRNDFIVKEYDLAHCSYALYYASRPSDVLESMRKALKPKGRLAIMVPIHPNGMVELARRFSEIPKKVDESLDFGTMVLRPYFNQFTRFRASRFRNTVKVPTVEDAIRYYRGTTYYDSEAEKPIAKEISKEIAEHGYFAHDKNGLLFIGYT